MTFGRATLLGGSVPKSNQVKKAEKAAKDKAKGVKQFALPLMPGSQQQLADLCARYQFDDWRELLTLTIAAMWQGSTDLTVPRHTYIPSQKVLRRLYEQGKLAIPEEED